MKALAALHAEEKGMGQAPGFFLLCFLRCAPKGHASSNSAF